MANHAARYSLLCLLTGCAGELASYPNQESMTAAVGFEPAANGTQSGVAGSFAGNTATAGPSAAAGAAGAAATGLMPSSFNLTGSPQYSRFVRLTNAQWARSVQSMLRLRTPPEVTAFQTAVSGTTDFTNNELVLSVDQRAAEDFQRAAETLADAVTATDEALAQVYPGRDPSAFVTTVGRRAYRRHLAPKELADYLTLFNSGATLSGPQDAFAKGAKLVVRALLQSPHFLYRTELGDAAAPLSTFEIAAKLSLWLRGTSPDDALLDAASVTNDLATPEGAAALAATMLAEPEALQIMRHFHAELYDFGRYANISKLGVAAYDPAINEEFLETSYRFFDKLFSQDQGVEAMLTSTQGFVGPRMAALYGVAAPAAGYEERELGAKRFGFFSQLPFLTLHGVNEEPDSIHRGVSMNLDVLCTTLGPPVAELPPVPKLKPGQTNRQRISQLTEGCGGVCHNQQINPLGFAFEHYDGMGRYRDIENGNLPVMSAGSFMFIEGAKSFNNAPELMQAIATGRQAHACYAKKLASFGLQRDIVEQDVPLLEALSKTSSEQRSIKAVIGALVKSDAFRVRAQGSL